MVEAGKRLIPVEVKYKQLKHVKVPLSLRSFIDKYTPEQAYVINLSLSKTLKIGKTTLYFLPLHELLHHEAASGFGSKSSVDLFCQGFFPPTTGRMSVRLKS